MRSRFSAYCLNLYEYILNTYAQKPQKALSVQELEQSAADTKWLKLEVVAAIEDKVEFKAYYQADNQFFCMHELSTFIKEGTAWRYLSGLMREDTGEIMLKRNDTCLCGSQKKFKKCCMG